MDNTNSKLLLPDPGIIFLIGFMGSGKSWTGGQLAEALNVPFVDLDDLIEQTSSLSISDIFTNLGEANFRIIESRTLHCLLGRPVVATGGGAPCYFQGMQYMNRVGTTVFLDPSENILLDRLSGEREHRPLLQNDAQLLSLIRKKMADRRPIYERAQIHLQYDDQNFDVVGELLRQIEDQP